MGLGLLVLHYTSQIIDRIIKSVWNHVMNIRPGAGPRAQARAWDWAKPEARYCKMPLE